MVVVLQSSLDPILQALMQNEHKYKDEAIYIAHMRLAHAMFVAPVKLLHHTSQITNF